MPETDVHKKNKKKNYIVLAIIIVFIAVFWAITMIKVAKAEPMTERQQGVSQDRVATQSPFDDIIFETIEPSAPAAPERPTAPNRPQDPAIMSRGRQKVSTMENTAPKLIPPQRQPQSAFRDPMQQPEFLGDNEVPGFATENYQYAADIPVTNTPAPMMDMPKAQPQKPQEPFANRRFENQFEEMTMAPDNSAPTRRQAARFERKGMAEKLVPILE